MNKRLFKGNNISEHPLASEQAEGVYVRGTPFLAIRADQGGMLETPEGTKTFHAGDWVCTDIPPSYAWIIDQQTFAVANYTRVGTMDPTDRMIVFTRAEGDNEVESSMYTGRLEVDDPTGGDFTLEHDAQGQQILTPHDPLASEHRIGKEQPKMPAPATKASLPKPVAPAAPRKK